MNLPTPPIQSATSPGPHRRGAVGLCFHSLLMGMAALLVFGMSHVLGSQDARAETPHSSEGGVKQCLSKWGRTVCGYDCKAKFGRVRCAKTPQGRCTVQHGVVKCWDPKGATTNPVKRPRKAQCLSAYGTTVCGYGCTKAFGRVRCAQTPGAFCKRDKGRIVCSDDGVKPWRRPSITPQLMPQGQCKSAHGMTRCGYGCIAKYGQVACADTPAGTCRAAYGRVTCWDPPHYRAGMKQARCLARHGMVACGYKCIARYGQIRCAQTPQGVCTAAYGKLTCWDPTDRQSKPSPPPAKR